MREADTRAELKNEFDASLEELKKHFSRHEDVDRLSGGPDLGTEEGQWSLFRTCKALATRDWSGAELEREVGDEMREKALAMGVDSSGGYIVPENYSAQIIELLNQENPLLQRGARILPGIKGSPLIMPKQATRASATYIGENTTIAKTQPTLGQIEFIPRTLAASTELSNVLRENATPAIEAFVTDDLRIQFDNALTTFGLTGNGSGFQPTGVLNEDGLTATTLATAVITFDDLVDMVHVLTNANALRGTLGWIMHPAVLQAIWKMKDSTELLGVGGGAGDPAIHVNTQPTQRRVITEGAPTMIMGYPFSTTTAMPASTGATPAGSGDSILFADWSQLLIPTWKTLELRATDVGAGTFLQDTMIVRALLRHDLGVRHIESFSLGDTF